MGRGVAYPQGGERSSRTLLTLRSTGQLSLVCIGPLTNVALAVRLDDTFLDNLQHLYILGGAAHGEHRPYSTP